MEGGLLGGSKMLRYKGGGLLSCSKLLEVDNKKEICKKLQHLGFPGGLPSRY